MRKTINSYQKLVAARKAERMPNGLHNPSEVDDGRYDCDHLSPWAKWQGNLSAEIVLVGQDWGDVAFFREYRGSDPDDNPTNRRLRDLFAEIGIDIGWPSRPNPAPVYLTNAILGLKSSGMAAKVNQAWADDHVSRYIAPLIAEVIRPRIVIAMGTVAYKAMAHACSVRTGGILKNIGETSAKIGSHEFLLAPRAHCSGLGLANRSWHRQLEDWRRLLTTLCLT